MSSLPQPLPPVPVQPIAYSTPVSQRPGLITAIGVISIVVGSLGLLFNGIGGLQAFAMVMVSQMTKAATTAQAAAKAAAAKPPPKPADPLSMPAGDRQTVVRGLAMHRAISKPRREQLDALLTKCGRQMFALRGADLTVDVVKNNVTESGQLPDAKGGEGPDFFVVGQGRIELADDHAKFVPSDGREIVRIDASETSEQVGWENGLTPAQVKGIVDKIETQAGQALPAAQKDKIVETLSGPGQGYFTPVATIPEATAQLNNVSYFVNNGVGQLTVQTAQGMFVLDQQGNVTSTMTWGGAGGGAAFVGPTMNVNMRAAVTVLITAALGIALSIYLLVIGILMLRQHPRAGRLHKIYAWLKIPLAIAGGIGWVVFWSSIATTAGTASATFTTGVIIVSVIAVLVGCVYPVSLLVALRSRAVREYYATVT